MVLSSSWRADPSAYAEVEGALRSVGVELIGKTDVLSLDTTQRPLEISAWLDAVSKEFYDTWVAIDDRSLTDCDGGDVLRGHFVRTRGDVGLTQHDAAQVERPFPR